MASHQLPMHFTAPHYLPLDRLRDALANNHLTSIVVNPNKRPGHLKVTPGRGVDRGRVEAFVKGYLAAIEC